MINSIAEISQAVGVGFVVMGYVFDNGEPPLLIPNLS